MNDQESPPKSTPATEEKLASVAVGKLVPFNKTIDLKHCNPEWPSMYARLEGQIRDGLCETHQPPPMGFARA
jgi:hypothetical protein